MMKSGYKLYLFSFLKFLLIFIYYSLNKINLFSNIIIVIYKLFKIIGGLGIGDWGLGIGPNPQSPIPNPQSPIPIKYQIIII